MSERRKLTTLVVGGVGAVAVLAGCGVNQATAPSTGVESAGHQRVHARMPLAHKSVPVAGPGAPTWWILESGPHARSIVIQLREAPATTAGCVVGSGATASETSSTIRLHVILHYRRAQACTADLRIRRIKVPLQRPIGGRDIQGAGLFWPTGSVLYLTESPHGLLIDRVPRVIGFAPGQAVQVLRAQSFRAVIDAGRGTAIVAQSPDRGRVPKDTDTRHQFSGTVHLTKGQ